MYHAVKKVVFLNLLLAVLCLYFKSIKNVSTEVPNNCYHKANLNLTMNLQQTFLYGFVHHRK